MTYTTRPAAPTDYAPFIALFGELGVPDPIPTLPAFEALLPQVIVATDASGVVGYACWRMYGTLAHVVNVVSARALRGRGIGHALMHALREAVVGEGATRWYLNVKQDNVAAIHLYEAHGLAFDGDAWTLEAGWSMRERLPPSPPAEVVTPSLDEVAAIGLVPDQLAVLVQRGRILIGLAQDRLVACAAFDPRFPGAYPFAAREPAYARALLDALYPHREPRHSDLVRVSIDHDEALVNLLLGAGATLTFKLWRMHGALA